MNNRQPAPRRPINNSQNIMGQVTPRPSPPVRPINSTNSVRQSPQIRPINTINSVRQSPQIRPINNLNGVRQSPQIRPVNSRPIPTRTQTTSSNSNLQNIPSRPLPPPVQPRSVSSPQLRPRNNNTYVPSISEQPSNSPKLPVRSQSSLSNLQQKSRPPLSHSTLSNSSTLDGDSFEPPIPPRTRQHRGTSISSQGSSDNYSTMDGSGNNSRKHSFDSNTNNSRKHSLSSEKDLNHVYDNSQNPNPKNYYDHSYNYSQNSTPQTSTPAPAPAPSQYPTQPQNGNYYNNTNTNPNTNNYNNNYNNNYHNPTNVNNKPPPGPQNYNYNYNSNKPLNFHPQAMYNGIGNQYRPPPQPKPKPGAYEGKLPMTSLGGQPMPYGQSLEMYRQNAKKSNDPHVQLEFAKYLIAMADAALDSDPDHKVARRNQEILYNEGLKWIKKLASQGGGLGKTPYAEAQFFLAECYGNGSIGLQIDHEKAFSYYLQASKQSHPPSTYRAAVCYEHGAGTKKDHQRAVQFYRKAAALGDVLSMYKLGTILLNGTLNQDKNPREGLTWLKRAAAQADQTCPHALHELGMIY